VPPRSAPKPADATRTAALELLRTLIATLSHSARAVERHTGVTNAQLFLLQQLDASDALSVNDLAARARTQQSTVSTVITRLVRAGLVRKVRAPDDARRAVLSLTPAAKRLLRHAPAPPTASLLHAVERLRDADARSLAAGLRALVKALRLESRQPAMLFEEPARVVSAGRPRRSVPARTLTRNSRRTP
jgi:DNA-binding MarR family transcriptional regulator